MFMRIGKLRAELADTKVPNPNAAAALQDLLGGKYGEIWTPGNSMVERVNAGINPSCGRTGAGKQTQLPCVRA